MGKQSSNYRIFLASNSVFAFAIGIFTPFWIIFIQNFGGSIEQFGFAIGLMVLSQSVTAYISGRFSDILGRKLFMLLGMLSLSGIVFLYTLISSLIELYILQILNGIAIATISTMETIFLGDVTKKSTRGSSIGKYNMILGVMAAVAMMGGGYIVGEFGFKIIFYIVSSIILISAMLLFKIRE